MLVANRAQVRDRRFRAALGCRASTDGTPESDAGDLRNLLHLEHRAEDRIAERHVFYRVLGWQHGPGELARPLLPGRVSPEVIDPQKAALLQVEPQSIRFFLRQPDGADI